MGPEEGRRAGGAETVGDSQGLPGRNIPSRSAACGRADVMLKALLSWRPLGLYLL